MIMSNFKIYYLTLYKLLNSSGKLEEFAELTIITDSEWNCKLFLSKEPQTVINQKLFLNNNEKTAIGRVYEKEHIPLYNFLNPDKIGEIILPQYQETISSFRKDNLFGYFSQWNLIIMKEVSGDKAMTDKLNESLIGKKEVIINGEIKDKELFNILNSSLTTKLYKELNL